MNFYEGTIRSGKSATAVNELFQCLKDGGVVGINFELVEGWSEIYAKRMLPKFATKKQILRLAKSFYERTYRIGSVESLYSFAENVKKQVTGRRSRSREEQGLLILDECGLFFNSREWAENRKYINFFTNSGKLKIETILISHSFDDIDKQIRAKIEYLTTFRNMKKLSIYGLPVKTFLRKPVFRSVTVLAGRAAGKGMKVETRWHFLNLKTCDLYDTFTLFSHGDKELDITLVGEDPQKAQIEKEKAEKLERYFKCAPASVWPPVKEVSCVVC